MTSGASQDLSNRLLACRANIAKACADSSRAVDEVSIMLATKTQPAQKLNAALAEGFFLFGENRLQDALSKLSDTGVGLDLQPDWHFIGRVQRRKIKKILNFCSMIQSVDSLEIARDINRYFAELSGDNDKTYNVLIQVNTSKEDTKGGVNLDGCEELIGNILELPRIKICGLMTLAAMNDSERRLRNEFSSLRDLAAHLNKLNHPRLETNILSMGMSGDYKIAIDEGSTLVRLGTMAFGDRAKN